MVLLSTFVALSFTITEALSMQVCGKALADVLDLVCSGRGFHWVKRDEGLPTIDKRTAVQYLTKRSTNYNSRGGGPRSGVVHECCHKACDIDHMESYCAAPQGTYFSSPTGAPMSPETAKELMRPITAFPSTAQPPTTSVPITSPATRPGGGPVGPPRRLKNKLFFFVRGMIRNRPTRTPKTRYDVQHH